jgi:hypothetical protein
VVEAPTEPVTDPGMEAGTPPGKGGGGGEGIPVATEETFIQKAWRFVLGIFGLDSGVPVEQQPVTPPSEEQVPVPVRPGKG